MTGPIIDISKFQGAHPWAGIRAAYDTGQIGGVIIRSSYGTASGATPDTYLTHNLNGARGTNTPLGFYHFAYPGRSSGRDQALGMAKLLGPLEAGEVVALDMEDDPAGRRLVPADVAWAVEFCRTLAGLLGTMPMLYVNPAMLARLDWTPVRDLGAKLWISAYGTNTGSPGTPPSGSPWRSWSLWQYTSRATLAGFGPVDASLLAPGVASLGQLGKSGQTAPPSSITPNPPGVPMDRPTAETKVRTVYRAVLGREPDPGGFENWVGALMRGMDLGSFLWSFLEASGPETLAIRAETTGLRAQVAQLTSTLAAIQAEPGGASVEAVVAAVTERLANG